MARKEAQLINGPPMKAISQAVPCQRRVLWDQGPALTGENENGQHDPSCGVGDFRVCAKQDIDSSRRILPKESSFLPE